MALAEPTGGLTNAVPVVVSHTPPARLVKALFTTEPGTTAMSLAATGAKVVAKLSVTLTWVTASPP